ncbi:aldo/keto reductase [Sunxiuqinia sp. A32]|uniref:aldo/keto reductase n=1 Tax=Sunxiuqinia sp. A32 TaxID=3461496 RepID=UPI00404659A0
MEVENAIDANLIPKKKLANGSEIPVIGLGTFGSDHISPEQVSEAVKYAVHVGFRHIDCAAVYCNEDRIGPILKELITDKVITREELWITSKVWNDKHGEGEVIESCKQSLKDLQLDYLDLYLVHWPFPNYHAPGCDVNSRNPDSRPYIHEEFMIAWRQMEKLVEMGLVKNIGTSNVTIPKLELILRDAKIKPTINEMEIHPHFQQPELFNYCKKNNIQPIGYSPVGSPARPERDKTCDDTVDIEDPVIVKIAQRLNVHPAVVCIKWAVQRGQIPIPFSSNPKNILSNLQAVISKPLTKEEMLAIEGIDKNCRLIKGQVFLWEGAKGWEDLWDIDGTITQ